MLLERGIFDDVIFGMVRFRHREVRELLATEWLADHLIKGNSRHAIEALLFREIYGQRFIAPRLRPLLPWLILLDEGVRRKAVAISPEIVIEGGDVALLPLAERRQLLQAIVRRIASDDDAGSARDNEAISRIAQPDLTHDVLRLIEEQCSHSRPRFPRSPRNGRRLRWRALPVRTLPGGRVSRSDSVVVSAPKSPISGRGNGLGYPRLLRHPSRPHAAPPGAYRACHSA